MLAEGDIVLGRYEVTGSLGEGGMGLVQRGRHLSLGYPVAIKTMVGETDAPFLGERFEREAALLARVNHANVVRILDFGRAGPTPVLVMELVDGAPLEKLVKRGAPLSWRVAVGCVAQALEGLQAIHAAGILHRDIKPANLVVTRAEPRVVKILDFGIAKSDTDARLTSTGFSVGTPAYMSPEQLHAERLDARTDVYSMALSLYELATGELPFEGAEDARLRRIVEPIPPPRPPTGMESIPQGVQRAILEALAPNPDHRPASAAAFRAALLMATFDAGERSTRITEPPPPELPNQATATSGDVEPRAPTQLAAQTGTLLVAARLPASRLARHEDRQYLTDAVGAFGRGYQLEPGLWVAISAELRSKARIEDAIKARYGASAVVAARLVDEEIGLSAAQLAGRTPLPRALEDLISSL
jgi:serine/threonine-protein kinase